MGDVKLIIRTFTRLSVWGVHHICDECVCVFDLHASNIMSAWDNKYQARSMFECVDSGPEYISGRREDRGRASVFYFITGDCMGDGNTFADQQLHLRVHLLVCTQMKQTVW